MNRIEYKEGIIGAEKKRQAINYLHWLPAYPHKLEKQKKKRAI